MSITMIGVDTAKSVFQIHAVDAAGKLQLKRKLQREEVISFFEQQERCTVVLEACGAGHHWARMLMQLGHEAKLLAPEVARPFVKKQKERRRRCSGVVLGGVTAGGEVRTGEEP